MVFVIDLVGEYVVDFQVVFGQGVDVIMELVGEFLGVVYYQVYVVVGQYVGVVDLVVGFGVEWGLVGDDDDCVIGIG